MSTSLASETSNVESRFRKIVRVRVRVTTRRIAIAFIFACMILSSPVFMLTTNPNQVLGTTNIDNPYRVDTSNYHSTPLVSGNPSPSSAVATPTNTAPPPPSVTSQDREFTTQAALSLTRASQTSNIVDSKAYYDISFRTSTPGVIESIKMSFPAGTYVGAALLVEATGIGPGTISAGEGGNTLAYTVTNAVNVPANTNIRIQIANTNNPPTPSNSLSVSITTRDSANAIIDGPTSTFVYNMKQVETDQIANGAVTSEKIADGAVTEAKISQDEINVVWRDSTEIFHRSNGNIDFQPPIGDLSNNIGTSTDPAIAASGNNVYVVWEDDAPDPNGILYRRSTDGGTTFSDTVNLSNSAGGSAQPAIAASGNNVYVVWEDFTPGNVDIFYRRSTDGGATFGSTVNLSNTAADSFDPAIDALGNRVYVVWSDTPSQLPNAPREVFLKRSVNGGTSFGFPQNISFTSGGASFQPSIDSSGNNVYVVWRELTANPSSDEIFYRRSTDGGAAFGSTINLSNNAGDSFQPAIAAINNIP